MPIKKEDRSVDDAYIDYIVFVKDKTNSAYLTFVLKFITLFRECFNLAKRNKNEKKDEQSSLIYNIKSSENNDEKDSNSNNNIEESLVEYSITEKPTDLPEFCNDFYSEFLESRSFFGFTDKEKIELIEIIQHFCLWLFHSLYTKSKLSLASS